MLKKLISSVILTKPLSIKTALFLTQSICSNFVTYVYIINTVGLDSLVVVPIEQFYIEWSIPCCSLSGPCQEPASSFENMMRAQHLESCLLM